MIKIRFTLSNNIKPNNKGLYEIKWFDNTIKLLETNDDFIFTSDTPEKGMIQCNTIYMLNKENILKYEIKFK